MKLVSELLSIALTAAPWLLLGLVIAGIIKAWMPEHLLQRWMGGRGLGSITRAAVIGMPLPLCSCGAIPTALALHRGGAGRGPTTSFLISTPGVGVDSVLLTSVLLGPLMALARVLGALVTAIITGVLVGFTKSPVVATAAAGGCCASKGCGDNKQQDVVPVGGWQRSRAGLRYAFSDLLDDISGWVFAGLLLAGVLVTLVPPNTMAGFSGGLGALMLMAVIGIPLYICAAAATPIAAGLLLAGISPGMALVFLLAGPITSLATLAILRRELGNQALAVYLGSVLMVTVLVGWLFDVALGITGWNPVEQASQVQELLPIWLEWLALVVLALVAIRPLRKRLMGF
ncbi:MAG: SO_0444 family Cu/Zn efflux transporter [Halomonas sp.]|nr:SO_0444 family Cu/Zn efflux transporter [Halomonas sp.]MCC5900631.1 SO_0444 family Cu/Zn efflux transporter [Halomonas sp.]